MGTGQFFPLLFKVQRGLGFPAILLTNQGGFIFSCGVEKYTPPLATTFCVSSVVKSHVFIVTTVKSQQFLAEFKTQSVR